MKAIEAYNLIGKEVSIPVKGLFYCDGVITDARENWSRVDVKVRPVSGRGEMWISLERVYLKESSSRADRDAEVK